MANNACIPGATNRLAERTANNPSKMLRDITQRTLQLWAVDKPHIRVAAEAYQEFLGKIGLGESEEVISALIDRGLVVDLNGVAVPVDQVNIDNLAPALAAVKTWYQGTGRGLQEMADNFLTKVYTGEDPLESGLAFAKQARGITQVGNFIMQNDRKMGQGLYVQRFQDAGFTAWASQRFGQSQADLRAAAVVGARDELTKAGELLNAGKVNEGLEILLTFADGVRLHGKPEDAIRWVNRAETVGNMIWTLAVNGLLSAPRTIIVNASSMANAIVRPMAQLAGALAYQTIGAPGLKNEAKLAAAEAAASLVGVQQASMDALRIFWHNMKTGKQIYSALGDIEGTAARLNGGWNAANIRDNILPEGAPRIEEGSAVWDLINMAGSVITTPGRLLGATDDATKHLTIRGQVQANAVRRMVKDRGIDALQDKALMRQYIEKEQGLAFDWANPDLDKQFELRTIYDQYARTMGEAKTTTFQEDNDLAAGINQFTNTGWGRLVKPFFPFVKTPLNILKQGFIDNTPIGTMIRLGEIRGHAQAKTLTEWHEGIIAAAKEDPDALFRHTGLVGMTGIITGVVAMQVMSGNMVGGGPRRWLNDSSKWEQDQAWADAKRAQGFSSARYEWKFEDGTTWDFSSFGEPFTIWAKMIADMAEFSGYMDEQDKEASLAMLALLGAKGFAEASFLQGFQNLMDLFDGTGRSQMKAAQGYAGVFTPFGGLLSYAGQLQAQGREVTYGYEGAGFKQGFWPGIAEFWDALTERWQQRVPGYGNNPEMLDPIFGKPVPITPGIGPASGLGPLELAIPFMPRGARESDELYADIYQLTGGYRPYRGPSTLKFTVAEQMRLNGMMGQVVINGKTKAQAFREFFARPEVREYMKTGAGVNRSLNFAPEREFRKIDREYGKLALQRLLAEDKTMAARYGLSMQRDKLKRRGQGTQEEVEATKRLNDQIEELYSLSRLSQVEVDVAPTMPILPSN
jgi:hypothetical protein